MFLTYYLKQKHQKYKIIKLKSEDCVQKKIGVFREPFFSGNIQYFRKIHRTNFMISSPPGKSKI